MDRMAERASETMMLLEMISFLMKYFIKSVKMDVQPVLRKGIVSAVLPVSGSEHMKNFPQNTWQPAFK